MDFTVEIKCIHSKILSQPVYMPPAARGSFEKPPLDPAKLFIIFFNDTPELGYFINVIFSIFETNSLFLIDETIV